MTRRQDRQAFVTGYTFAMLWANTYGEDGGEVPDIPVNTLRRKLAPGVARWMALDARVERR